MAAEFHVFAVHNLEASGCRFVVRDTLGVAAADKTDKSVGENYRTLFHYLVVTDYVHNSRGCYDSYRLSSSSENSTSATFIIPLLPSLLL